MLLYSGVCARSDKDYYLRGTALALSLSLSLSD